MKIEEMQRLNEIADKASAGPWFIIGDRREGVTQLTIAQVHGDRNIAHITFRTEKDRLKILDKEDIANTEFIALANPKTVKELLAMANTSKQQNIYEQHGHLPDCDYWTDREVGCNCKWGGYPHEAGELEKHVPEALVAISVQFANSIIDVFRERMIDYGGLLSVREDHTKARAVFCKLLVPVLKKFYDKVLKNVIEQYTQREKDFQAFREAMAELGIERDMLNVYHNARAEKLKQDLQAASDALK